ncbi:Clavaminate synthase-like protein [Bimuria novae-zelandiae CBS 107.79]|uniref:Clavaminate synthase-like protein n=1 Tax=Bimuria novae-zelandiae CBS 107.79 TaxID=1447943 RepID=A0A6A5UMQ9_9PLEO|nr:Clavaminate synthase-like protein [Bimuria novae-zelandiae CBS 107.79]
MLSFCHGRDFGGKREGALSLNFASSGAKTVNSAMSSYLEIASPLPHHSAVMAETKVTGLTRPEQAIPRPAPTGLEGEGTLHDAVRDLICTYHDLNPSTFDELDDEPSPLEFMRYVTRNRPFVVRKGAATWAAHKKWDANYLTSILRDTPVNVAITPVGNADSILPLSASPDYALFVKPLERTEPFTFAMHKIQSQALEEKWGGPTHYLQTQNDNLRGEYATLFKDVPESIPWARIALEKEPDAINFWLGNSASTTALHKDNYENVYVQVLGKKHFVLLPPVEAPCVNEKAVLAATYTTNAEGDIKKEDLVAKIDEPEDTYVPFATWDPDRPETNATPFSQYSRPLRATLEEGDVLYLPALWYHKVSQSCNSEGLCCAVNYWYDLDFSGSFWATSSFVRGVGLLSQQQPKSQTFSQPSPFSSDAPPQTLSNAEKSSLMDSWVRDFKHGAGLGTHSHAQHEGLPRAYQHPPSASTQDAPQAWSNAQKSSMIDQWVQEWQGKGQAQAQAQAQVTPTQHMPPASEGQVPPSDSDAEKSSTMGNWMQQWKAAQK